MVCLVRPYGSDNLLNEIREHLRHAQPYSIRHSWVPLGQSNLTDEPITRPKRWTADDVGAVRRILRDARNELVRFHPSKDRRLRFPLFSLVNWLMDQERDPDDENPDGALRRKLREQGLIRRINSVSRNIQDELPDEIRWKIPLWILRGLSLITFRIAVTGRVRGLSGPCWWFMHQPHLAPEMTNTFDRFAGRLIDGEWQREAPEQVARLLVNAFLEDLRRSYLLRPWHLFRKRPMTYPVLLLDNITVHNGGFDLLILINLVRNQVGVFDPLLVVSVSRTVPEAFLAFNAWQDQLLDDRRARRDTT